MASDHETIGRPTDWSAVNWAIVGLFTGLTVVGVALAIGVVDAVVDADGGSKSPVAVPLYVYLYSGLGALGYVVTKLMHQFERSEDWNRVSHLVGLGLRIPAAWILATGFFLFLGEFGGASATSASGGANGGSTAATDGGTRLAAGIAFLVGLYVNVALKALGSLADRVLGRGRPDGGGEERPRGRPGETPDDDTRSETANGDEGASRHPRN